MQEQKNTIISKETLIPISLIVVVVGIVWSMAISFSKIEMLEQRNSPTRDEFTTLQSDIKEIKGDIKTLLISSKEYEKR